MGRKSRIKRERKEAEEILKKRKQGSVDLSSEESNANWGDMKQSPLDLIRIRDKGTEILRDLFNREGEEGLRKYYKQFGPPVVALNSRNEIVPMGWVIKEGRLVIFMTRFMVSDGNGGFMCRDCQRGYFECICSD